jgi:hypothetical protein
VTRERLARDLAVAVHDVEHAGRSAGLHEQLREPQAAHGRLFRRLQDDAVAGVSAGAIFQVAMSSG